MIEHATPDIETPKYFIEKPQGVHGKPSGFWRKLVMISRGNKDFKEKRKDFIEKASARSATGYIEIACKRGFRRNNLRFHAVPRGEGLGPPQHGIHNRA